MIKNFVKKVFPSKNFNNTNPFDNNPFNNTLGQRNIDDELSYDFEPSQMSQLQMQLPKKMQLERLEVNNDFYKRWDEIKELEIEELEIEELQLEELQVTHEIIKERNEQIKEIEQEINIINEIFTEFGAFLNIQGEQINQIDTSLEQAKCNVQDGIVDLEQAEKMVVKKRKWVTDVAIVLGGIGLGSLALLGGPITGVIGIAVGGTVGGGVVYTKRKIQTNLKLKLD